MTTTTKTRYRRVLASHDEVAHVWAQQSQEEGRAGNMFFDEKSIFSYGRHFEIARFITDDVVLFNSNGYSNSTAKHKSLVWRAIRHKTVFTVPSMYNHDTNIRHYVQRANEQIERAARSRKYADMYLNDAIRFVREMQKYAKQFKQELPAEAAQLVAQVENEQLMSEDAIQKVRQKIKERNAKILAEKKEDIEKWIAGEKHSLSGIDRIYLRRDGESVETSEGATVSALEARLLYHALKAGKDVEGQKIGYYTVISFDGKVLQIGCHKLEIAEINRFAATQNW